MELETKYLRLRTPVTLGSRFGEWQVRWLGGWNRDRLFYLVMLVKLRAPIDYAPMPGSRLAFKASNLRILCHAQNPESTIHRERDQ